MTAETQAAWTALLNAATAAVRSPSLQPPLGPHEALQLVWATARTVRSAGHSYDGLWWIGLVESAVRLAEPTSTPRSAIPAWLSNGPGPASWLTDTPTLRHAVSDLLAAATAAQPGRAPAAQPQAAFHAEHSTAPEANPAMNTTVHDASSIHQPLAQTSIDMLIQTAVDHVREFERHHRAGALENLQARWNLTPDQAEALWRTGAEIRPPGATPGQLGRLHAEVAAARAALRTNTGMYAAAIRDQLTDRFDLSADQVDEAWRRVGRSAEATAGAVPRRDRTPVQRLAAEAHPVSPSTDHSAATAPSAAGLPVAPPEAPSYRRR